MSSSSSKENKITLFNAVEDTWSKDTITVRHSNSFILVGVIAWVVVILTLSVLPGSAGGDVMAYVFVIAGAIALFAGGIVAFRYHFSWCVKLQGQTITFTPVFGKPMSYDLSEITEFVVKPDRYRYMPSVMRRELGNMEPTTIVDAMLGNKRLFSTSSSDFGFTELCKRLKLQLPDYSDMI